MRKIIIVFFIVLLTNQLWSATITVTNTNDSGSGSIREAFENAKNGDEIRFDASLANQTIVLTSGRLQTSQSITIDGSEAPNLTIDGNSQDRIIRLGWQFDASIGENVPTTCIIRNLKFINGRAKGLDEDGSGGAIYMLPVGQTLTVENCIFENNYSEGFGGSAIYCGFKGILTVDNCQFTGNIAEPNDDTPNSDDKGERAATISTNGDGTLTVTNSTFINNRGINGAGINTVDTDLLVENCVFENNDTKFYPEQEPSPSEMSPNRAYGYGGAVYTDGSNRQSNEKTQTLRNCRFIGNIASGQGGAVFLFGYKGDFITVENCTFSQNEVISAAFAGNGFSLGGGLVISGGGSGSRTESLPNMEVLVRNSTFDNNRSYDQGGGFWLRITNQGTAEVNNCTIANNQSVSENATDTKGLGGGLTVTGTEADNTIILNNLTIANNIASHQGGGMYVNEGNNISMYNSIVAYNEARNAGNDWNIMHNTNNEMKAGSNNIQTNELGTDERFLGQLTPNTQTIDPLLEDLADNGGPTQTMALKEGSPAIDAGTDCIELDQRNATRQGACDLGAYEVGGVIENPILPPVSSGNGMEGNEIEVEAFNILTPNGDGQNDTWQINNLSGTYKIRVFTKTGQLVFESEDYNTNTWDGTKDGQELPEGIYYYAISFEESKDVETGYITLIR